MRLPLVVLLSALLWSGCSAPHPGPEVLELGDHAISGVAVWRGEVLIRGVVTVTKEGHLTIAPGTRVRFARIDRDGDGIGDAELLVEGGLVARGTAEAPIIFTSAAADPAPADWKYLYLDFAREGEIEHIISEYAYSGIQVHFCKARIRNSVFRHNVDGVRFSTVNLEVSGNLIHDNAHGLRYEERRSTARIHHNTFRDNQIGLFVVTRSSGGALIELNNILDSRNYQVKFALEQRDDVAFPRNWWGTPNPEEQFFDRRRDPALGRASAPEPLSGPVAGAP